jgi:hypothetical protein
MDTGMKTECNCWMPDFAYFDWLREQGWENVEEYCEEIVTGECYYEKSEDGRESRLYVLGPGWSYGHEEVAAWRYGYESLYGTAGNGNGDRLRECGNYHDSTYGSGFALAYIDMYGGHIGSPRGDGIHDQEN